MFITSSALFRRGAMTDSTRVNETIAFIKNYTGSNNNVTPVQRQAAAQFCRLQYPKLKLLDFGPYNHEFHTLSSDMSVKQHAAVRPAATPIAPSGVPFS